MAMFCIYCGSKLLEAANFCSQCGKPVAAPRAEEKAPVSPIEQESIQQERGLQVKIKAPESLQGCHIMILRFRAIGGAGRIQGPASPIRMFSVTYSGPVTQDTMTVMDVQKDRSNCLALSFETADCGDTDFAIESSIWNGEGKFAELVKLRVPIYDILEHWGIIISKEDIHIADHAPEYAEQGGVYLHIQDCLDSGSQPGEWKALQPEWAAAVDACREAETARIRESQKLYNRIQTGGFQCACGKYHAAALEQLVLGTGALEKIPALVQQYNGTQVFVLTDCSCYAAAGGRVLEILDTAKIPHREYVFPQSHLEPDEFAVGAAVMHFNTACDLIIGVGSGVINDIGKILAAMTGKPYFIVGTAPSMDGYASATSSMARDGLKISLPSTCPKVIIGDLEVLCNAPMEMLQSGLGDMVAKYISICEWRIAHELVGEDYCEEIADMVRKALDKCMDNARGLAKRDPAAVLAVMEGLVVTGIAMSYAGLSRPASGMEHYFSHVWDMRGLEFGTPVQTHGIQCGIGTLLSLKVYDYIRSLTPDREKALAQAAAFDRDVWNTQLRTFLGKGAEAMIQGEAKEGKYDPARHAVRLEKLLVLWPRLLEIMAEELPAYSAVEKALQILGAPTGPEAMGLTREAVITSLRMTKDIRDKYIGSRLLWDLGELETAAQIIF